MEARPQPELIGQSKVFLDALTHASAAAPLDRPLLILGERGTGKELIAERVHFLSPRWEGPLIKLNCAALSEELLESELFGHEAGAFTGARTRHEGRFERAKGGTLFLDEIAAASLRVQEKLLRVIEYGEFERVGGETTLNADVRVIAAANSDLRGAAGRGAFRADLLDRLAFDVIATPPLRTRKDDISILAAHFASKFAQEQSARDPSFVYPGFAPEALAALQAHDWPGNVRELKNAAERSLYRWISAGNGGPVGEAVIDVFGSRQEPGTGTRQAATATHERPDDIADDSWSSRSTVPGSRPYDLRARLDEIERQLVEEALQRHQWNQKRAAEALTLTYDQMRGLVRKHQLTASA
jgi:psp operon transcriptional activator